LVAWDSLVVQAPRWLQLEAALVVVVVAEMWMRPVRGAAVRVAVVVVVEESLGSRNRPSQTGVETSAKARAIREASSSWQALHRQASRSRLHEEKPGVDRHEATCATRHLPGRLAACWREGRARTSVRPCPSSVVPRPRSWSRDSRL